MEDIVYTKEIVNIGELRDRIDAAALQFRAEINNIVITQNVQKRALACMEVTLNNFFKFSFYYYFYYYYYYFYYYYYLLLLLLLLLLQLSL